MAGAGRLMGMKTAAWILGMMLCGALLSAQRERMAPPRGAAAWEYRALLPRETAPGVFRQVDAWEVAALGEQGWELVSVTPWVIRNDERKYKGEENPRVVTQSYLAYYFKRQKLRAE